MDQHIWNWALQVESLLQTQQVQEDDPNKDLKQLKVYFLGEKTKQTKYSQLGCFKVINKLMTSLQGLSTAMESPQMSPPAAGDTAHKTQGNKLFQLLFLINPNPDSLSDRRSMSS